MKKEQVIETSIVVVIFAVIVLVSLFGCKSQKHLGIKPKGSTTTTTEHFDKKGIVKRKITVVTVHY